MRRFVCVLLLAALAGCQDSRPAGNARNVRIAIHRDPIAFLPVRVAQTLEYYQQENLAVDLSEVAGGTKAIEALIGGSVDVAAGTMSDAIHLAAEGREVRCFLLLYTRPTFVLAVTPALNGTIRTIGDLKGRTVGVTTPGSASHQFLNFLLVSNNLRPDDVSVVSVGMAGSSVAALEHGKVDAAILLASAISTFEARRPGQPFLADARTPAGTRRLFGDEVFPTLCLMSQDRWLRQHADTARRLVEAVKQGMRWVRDHPAEQVRGMIPAGDRLAQGEADLEAIRGIQQAMSRDGLVPDGSVERIRRFVAVSDLKAQTAPIDITHVYTNEFASMK